MFLSVCFLIKASVFFFFFGGLQCVGHFFTYVAHLVFLENVWIRTQRAAVASRCDNTSPCVATHIPISLPISLLSHPPP
jgi:hypothetical protein